MYRPCPDVSTGFCGLHYVRPHRMHVPQANMRISGQCHCGAIKFTATVDPAKVIACHCEDCQAFSGAPFRTVLPVPVGNVTLFGKPKVYVKVAESGTRRAQAFCSTCGTQLYATEPETPKVLNIRLGCVNERAQLPPMIQIWGQSAMPWLQSLSSVPIHSQGSCSVLMGKTSPPGGASAA